MTEQTCMFPTFERVIYQHNPLNEVVCQVRFPPILRISSEVPATFQERVRSRFPEYGEELNAAVVQPGLPAPIVQLLSGNALSKRHRFGSRDGKFAVLLDGQSLTFVAGEYRDWDEFSSSVFETLAAFQEIYSPAFYSRIGLRYQNLISCALGGEGASWGDLIRPELVGVLADPDWNEGAFEFHAIARTILVPNSDTDKLVFQYGLAALEAVDEPYFRLDFDYYVEEETDAELARDTIARLHGYSGNAFRWAITSRLHEALGPQSPD